jgi:hypothetical protein
MGWIMDFLKKSPFVICLKPNSFDRLSSIDDLSERFDLMQTLENYKDDTSIRDKRSFEALVNHDMIELKPFQFSNREEAILALDTEVRGWIKDIYNNKTDTSQNVSSFLKVANFSIDFYEQNKNDYFKNVEKSLDYVEKNFPELCKFSQDEFQLSITTISPISYYLKFDIKDPSFNAKEEIPLPICRGQAYLVENFTDRVNQGQQYNPFIYLHADHNAHTALEELIHINQNIFSFSRDKQQLEYIQTILSDSNLKNILVDQNVYSGSGAFKNPLNTENYKNSLHYELLPTLIKAVEFGTINPNAPENLPVKEMISDFFTKLRDWLDMQGTPVEPGTKSEEKLFERGEQKYWQNIKNTLYMLGAMTTHYDKLEPEYTKNLTQKEEFSLHFLGSSGKKMPRIEATKEERSELSNKALEMAATIKPNEKPSPEVTEFAKSVQPLMSELARVVHKALDSDTKTFVQKAEKPQGPIEIS